MNDNQTYADGYDHPYPVARQTPDQGLAAHAGAGAPQFAMTRQGKEGRTNHTSQCQDAGDARRPENAEALERDTRAPTDKTWRLKNTAGYTKTGADYRYHE